MKKTMKKTIIGLLAFGVAFAAILGGCGTKGSKSEKQESGKQTVEEGSSVLGEGSEALDFTVDMAGGGTFTLSENQGKVVLVNFWATWCSPCVGEMPALQKLYEEYGEEVSIAAVNVAEDKATVDAFLSENQYTFPVAYDEAGSVSDLYQTEGIPYSLIIGKDGTISSIFVGSAGADEQYQVLKDAIDQARAK